MSDKAVFTSGSTMRHVVVMTLTSATGLMALFLVDALNLLYISLLGVTELAAAIGFAGAIQFFMLSVSIGLMIAGVALVSRAIGAGERERARAIAGASMATTVLFLAVFAGIVWIFRDEAVGLLGAEGEARRLAGDFLEIALFSVPMLGIGMASSATLRAVGAARDAMFVTLTGGVVAAILDPILIFVLDLRLTGAAISIVLTRCFIASFGFWLVARRHGMLAWPGLGGCARDLPRIAKIAGPAMATQLSTPFGMAYLTSVIAAWGDDAVAGWAVIGRITALAFGGIFALAGAVGPIVGQNYGAGLYPRIAMAYRDALLFTAVYVLVAWFGLWLATGVVISGFGLTGAGAEVVAAFTHIGAVGYLFAGFLFVSNAAFNNLGRPLWSTGFNWSRDGLVLPGLVAVAATAFGTATAVYLQAGANLMVGTAAALVAWRLVHRITGPEGEPMPMAVPAITSGRAAEAGVANPLASGDQNR